MEQSQQKKQRGCLKTLSIGCLVIVVLIAAVFAVIWSKRDAIRGSAWYKSMTAMAHAAKAEMEHMLELRQSLLADYPSEQIQVQAQQQSMGAKTMKSLVVGFVNPRFIVPDGASAARDKAREIARIVASRYPGIERYDYVTVSFVAKKGAGITFSTSSSHPFATTELLKSP